MACILFNFPEVFFFLLNQRYVMVKQNAIFRTIFIDKFMYFFAISTYYHLKILIINNLYTCRQLLIFFVFSIKNERTAIL